MVDMVDSRVSSIRGATQRLGQILGSDDAQAIVAEMPEQEFYLLVSKLGIEDSLELLELATPQQVQTCLDFDIWEKDVPEVELLKPWLSALMEIGYEKTGEVWESLDIELTALILARSCEVFDASLGEHPDDADERPLISTPDQFFTLALKTDDPEQGKWIGQLIDYLYRYSQQVARHTIMSARSEMPSYLEEMAYRWRSGRMADLGYIDFYEALNVYKPIRANDVKIGEGTLEVALSTELAPAPTIDTTGFPFLSEALSNLDEAERHRMSSRFLLLVNQILSAKRAKPGDEKAMEQATEEALSTLQLGVEFLAEGDSKRAAEGLSTVALQRIHRVGITQIRKCATLAKPLRLASPPFDGDAALILQALANIPPSFAQAALEPGQDSVRPFSRTAELSLIAQWLTEMAISLWVIQSLGIENTEQTSVADILRTSLLATEIDGEQLYFRFLTRSDLSKITSWRERDQRWSHMQEQWLALASSSPLAAHGSQWQSLFARLANSVDRILEDVDDSANPKFLAGILFEHA